MAFEEETVPKDRLLSITQSVTDSAWFEETEAFDDSLESYRHVWLILFDRTKILTSHKVIRGPPIGGVNEFHVEIPELPLYTWSEIEVVTPIGPDKYKVQVQGCTYGCLTPRDADFFSREFPMWEVISSANSCIRAPKLRGLIRSDRLAQGLRGILYDWIEPIPGTNTLRSVPIYMLSYPKRLRLYNQVATTVKAVHQLNLRCIRQSVFSEKDAASRIIVDAKGNAYFAMIAFGAWVKRDRLSPSYAMTVNELVLNTNPKPDFRFLRFLGDFLKINTNAGQTNDRPQYWNMLPADLRNIIYELLLVDTDPVMYRYKEFVRRISLEPDSPFRAVEAQINSQGLFTVSKSIRQEAVSLFTSKNCFYVEAIAVPEFLASLADCLGYLKHVIILVSLDEGRESSSIQSAGIKLLREEAKNLRAVEVIVHNHVGSRWMGRLPVFALRRMRGIEHFKLSPDSFGFREDELAEVEEYFRNIVFQPSRITSSH